MEGGTANLQMRVSCNLVSVNLGHTVSEYHGTKYTIKQSLLLCYVTEFIYRQWRSQGESGREVGGQGNVHQAGEPCDPPESLTAVV